MQGEYDVAIVGAGLAGLAAAIELEKFELKTIVIDKADRVGGRLKTDEADGFLFDHGFQVYLDAYPEGKALLNYSDLDLRAFEPGAVCFDDHTRFIVKDTTRKPSALPRMAFSPVGSFMDKIRMGNLAARLKSTNVEDIFIRPEHTTLDYLRQQRFSEKIIERFFQPFFSGIFLEPKLKTSSRMFEFVFKMMSEGLACVPNEGMEMIPRQMRSRLKNTEFRFHTAVKEIREQELVLEGTDNVTAKHIIIATDPSDLVPQLAGKTEWKQTATYYFSAPKSPMNQNMIALNFSKKRLVNNFCVISDIAPGYAPSGQHLISVSLTEIPDGTEQEIAHQIKNELSDSFGDQVQAWELLRSFHLTHALPKVQETRYSVPISETKIRDGLYLAGDQMLNASINASLKSGLLAAQEAVLQFRSN